MVLVFILLTILSIFIFIGLLLIISKIQISIKDVLVSSEEVNSYNLQISWYIFGKIKLFRLQWDTKKIQMLWKKLKIQAKKIDLKKLEKEFPINKENINLLKQLKVQIRKFNLTVKIGTEDALLTSFLVFFISNMLALILPHIIKVEQAKQYHYHIVPSYKNENIYKILFNCIIDVKMVHIIHIIYILLKKGISDKHERTSNRRSYDYSYE